MSNLNGGIRRHGTSGGSWDYRIARKIVRSGWARYLGDTRRSGVQQAGRDGLGQLVGPGIAAKVESGVAEAGAGLLGQKIDAGKAALREFVPAGQWHAVLSGPKFVEVDNRVLFNTVFSFRLKEI